MQVSNNIHYTSDAYLISKKQYEADHKEESQPSDEHVDISSAKLEEEIYAKSINSLSPQQVAVAGVQSDVAVSNKSGNNSTSDTGLATEKAVASYNEIENNPSSQEQFNLVKEMV